MQILLISGFLGAGKTTFIQALVKATGKQFVIIENEFSEFNIDAPVLTAEAAQTGTKDNLSIWELTEGCICCSTNLDFSSSVLTIANTIDPDFLIVEPSGVALPSRIINNIKPICYERIGLLAPLVILDAQHYRTSRKDFSAYFDDQLSTADTIVLSKSESLSTDEFKAIAQDLGLSKDVDFPLTHYGKWEPAQWLKLFSKHIVWSDKENSHYHIEHHTHDHEAEDDLENMGLMPFAPPSLAFLVNRLEALLSGYYGRIVRAKGYFTLEGAGFRFDMVDGMYAITGITELDEPKAVFIGQGLKREEIERIFRA